MLTCLRMAILVGNIKIPALSGSYSVSPLTSVSCSGETHRGAEDTASLPGGGGQASPALHEGAGNLFEVTSSSTMFPETNTWRSAEHLPRGGVPPKRQGLALGRVEGGAGVYLNKNMV